MLRLVAPVDFLLQDDAVDTRLEQGEHQARLSLELAQAVEYLRRRLGGHVVEYRGKLRGEKTGSEFGALLKPGE